MEHTPASFEVPELEKILAKKKKRYVGYEEGMALYFNEKDFVPKAGTGSSRTPPHKKDGDRRSGYSG